MPHCRRWAKFKAEETDATRTADKHKADENMARTKAAAAAEARASIIGRHASKAMQFHAKSPARPVLRRTAVDASALPGRVASLRGSKLSPDSAVLNAGGQRSFASAAAGAARWRSAQTLASSATSAHTADAVVVGAGIMGLNIAYQLRRRDPHAKIVVLEQAPALGFGSSGYSTGFQVKSTCTDLARAPRFPTTGIAQHIAARARSEPSTGQYACPHRSPVAYTLPTSFS
jgi:hypothetical protein